MQTKWQVKTVSSLSAFVEPQVFALVVDTLAASHHSTYGPNKDKTAVCASSIFCFGWLGVITVSWSIGQSDRPPGCSALFQCSSLVQGKITSD